MSEQDL